MSPKKKEAPSFEGNIARLEEIVALLERGDTPLAGSLALFEEGTRLAAACTAMLDEAEQKVKLLTAGEDGILTFTHPAQERGWRREGSDRLYAVLLEKELMEVQVVELNTRSEEEPVTVTLEEGWQAENLCVYVFFRAAKGKKVSDSKLVEVKV